MRKAFTLIELTVAVALLAMMISFASLIFDMSIDTYRTATASAEIMQKLQAITGQLNADFKGLRKDGEIFVVWVAKEAVAANYDGYRDCDNDGYERFDRIMFFAGGDFQSYGTEPMVRGNVARICYMLAKDGNGKRASEYRDLSLTEEGRKLREKDRRGRMLARTQHITSAITSTIPDHGLLSIGSLTPANLNTWHNIYEYDTIPLEGWKNIPLWPDKAEILTAITDIITDDRIDNDYLIGAKVDPADANSIHVLLCEGVGEFKVQGWYAAEQRWVPEVDPDGDGDLTDDSDFFTSGGGGLDPYTVPGVLYPYPPNGRVSLGGGWNVSENNYFRDLLNEAKFDYIPGLGRALKFTFTLYDSKGVLEEGKTFTHIVYLGD